MGYRIRQMDGVTPHLIYLPKGALENHFHLIAGEPHVIALLDKIKAYNAVELEKYRAATAASAN